MNGSGGKRKEGAITGRRGRSTRAEIRTNNEEIKEIEYDKKKGERMKIKTCYSIIYILESHTLNN